MLKRFTGTLFTGLLIFCSATAYSQESRWVKPAEGTISNPFGNGYDFFGYYRAGHTGIDIRAPFGADVVAAAAGTVKFIKDKKNKRYGNYIVIEHEKGLYTLYAHLDRIHVRLEEKVAQGKEIGTVGLSGLASYSHLHFEVIDQVPVKDGAWGYNYICRNRKVTASRSGTVTDRETKPVKLTYYDHIPLREINNRFAFLNAPEKKMESFYRMKNNRCIEESIEPITYFNPENFLPPYKKSTLPDFKALPVARALPKMKDKPAVKMRTAEFPLQKARVQAPRPRPPVKVRKPASENDFEIYE